MRRGRRADARSPRSRCSRRRAKPSRSHVQARQSSRRCQATASPRQPAPGYKPRADTHTHMCTRAFNGPLSGTTRMLKQETVSGSSISRAICKSAPCSRQITMPAPHRMPFLPPNQQHRCTEGCLGLTTDMKSLQPTRSIHVYIKTRKHSCI